MTATGDFIHPLWQQPDKVERPTQALLIETLLPQLGFYETVELSEASQAVLIAINEETNDPSRLQAAWTEYAIIGEQIVDNAEITPKDIETRAKIQLALIIHKALILRESNQIPRYIESLDYAETHANTKGFYAIASILEHELESIANNTELSPESLLAKLKGEMSEMNRERLRDLIDAGVNLEDLIAAARDALQKEHRNTERSPDVVFTELGIMSDKEYNRSSIEGRCADD